MTENEERRKSKMDAIAKYLFDLVEAEKSGDATDVREALEHLQGVLGSMVEAPTNADDGDLLVIEGCGGWLVGVAHELNKYGDNPALTQNMFDMVCSLVRMWGGKP